MDKGRESLLTPLRIIDQDGIYAEIYGHGEPLFCIHGNRGAAPVFLPLIERLQHCYMFIAIDLPGHRFGPPLDDDFVLNEQASVSYCMKVLAVCGINKVHVCGHSLGGMIALLMAIQHPERVLSVILLDSFVNFTERQNTCQRLMAFPGSSKERRYEVFKAMLYGPGVIWHNYFDVSDKITGLSNVLELIGESYENSEEDFTQWIKAYRNEVGQDWKIVMVPQSGHFVMLENSDFVAEQLKAFLKE